MAKVRYSAGLKATAVVAQQIFSVVLVLCMIVLAVLFQKDILDFGNMKDKSFEGSGYFSAKFQEAADEVLNFTDLRKKFETDGSYDSEKEVDIWEYRNNREVAIEGPQRKEEAALCYTLGDLSEWSRSYSNANYEFVSSFSLDHGIQQKPAPLLPAAHKFQPLPDHPHVPSPSFFQKYYKTPHSNAPHVPR